MIIERRDAVDSDLQIGYYVAMQDDQKLEKEALDDVMVTYQDEIESDVGISVGINFSWRLLQNKLYLHGSSLSH